MQWQKSQHAQGQWSFGPVALELLSMGQTFPGLRAADHARTASRGTYFIDVDLLHVVASRFAAACSLAEFTRFIHHI